MKTISKVNAFDLDYGYSKQKLDQKYLNKPLKVASDDQLGRRDFVEQIARIIKNQIKTENVRIGIYGASGAGKTSVLNLLENQFANDNAISFAKFDSWLHMDESHLFQKFYLLIARLRGVTTTSVEMLAPYTESIATATEMLSSVPGTTGGLIKILSELFKVLRARDGLTKNKGRIQKALDKDEKRIVVAIDEFDYLSDDEIQKVFRFIKLAACFPEVAFVVTCDQERALKALAPIYGGVTGAKNFMTALLPEKYDLPAATSYALSEMTLDGLHYVAGWKSPLQYLNLSEREKRQIIKRIDKTFGIKLETPRRVKSYVNDVAVKLKPLMGEVNSLEFALIQAFRCFYPLVYKSIQENSELFCGTRTAESDKEKERAQNVIAAALSDLPDNQQQHLIAELARLFPLVAAYYGLSEYAARQTEEELEVRQSIASKDYFYRYFDCRIRADDISDNAVEALLTTSDKRNRFSHFLSDDLAEFINTGGTALVARKIRRLVKQIPSERIEDAIEATAQLGEQLSSNRGTATAFPALSAQVCETVQRLLARIENLEKRDAAALKIVEISRRKEFAMYCVMQLSETHSSPIETDGIAENQMPLLSKNGVNELYRKTVQTALRSRTWHYKPAKNFCSFCESWQRFDQIEMDEFFVNEFAKRPRAATEFLIAAAASEFGVLMQHLNVADIRKCFQRVIKVVEFSIISAALQQDVQETTEINVSSTNDDCKIKISAEIIPKIFLKMNEDV